MKQESLWKTVEALNWPAHHDPAQIKEKLTDSTKADQLDLYYFIADQAAMLANGYVSSFDGKRDPNQAELNTAEVLITKGEETTQSEDLYENFEKTLSEPTQPSLIGVLQEILTEKNILYGRNYYQVAQTLEGWKADIQELTPGDVTLESLQRQDPNGLPDDGTLAHSAAWNNSKGCLQRIPKEVQNQVLDLKAYGGNTVLHTACQQANTIKGIHPELLTWERLTAPNDEGKFPFELATTGTPHYYGEGEHPTLSQEKQLRKVLQEHKTSDPDHYSRLITLCFFHKLDQIKAKKQKKDQEGPSME